MQGMEDDWQPRPRDLRPLCPILPEETLRQLRNPGPPFYMFVTAEMARLCLPSVSQWGVWLNRPHNGQGRIVGRSATPSGIVPVEVRHHLSEAFLATLGLIETRNFEVLLVLRGRPVWVRASGGDVPPYALPLGLSPNGKQEYAVRVKVYGYNILGMMQSEFSSCHAVVPCGVLKLFSDYEVLAIMN